MALLNRISGIPDPGQSPEFVDKLGLDHVLAFMAEIKRGNLTAGDAATALNLSAGEQTALTAIYNKIKDLTPAQRESKLKELTEIFSLAESGLAYTTISELQDRIDLV